MSDLQFGTQRSAKVELYAAGSTQGIAGVATNADGQSTSSQATHYEVSSRNTLYNGASYDRQRGNMEVSLLTSSARTTTQTGSDQVNYNGKGLYVVLDVTSAGTGSITLDIQGKDAVSGKYYSLLTGAAVTTNSTNIYKVYPGFTAVANAKADDVLPRTWRVVVTANNANSITYSVGAVVIL